MKFHDQKFKHDPENGIYGDCMRTVLACLLDKQPEEVPHFLHDNCDGAEFTARIDAYLETQALAMVRIAFAQATVQEILDVMASNNPNMRIMVSGQSVRGVNHVVIACNGEIEHDTHPSKDGLCAPMDNGQVQVEFLVPRNIHVRIKADK